MDVRATLIVVSQASAYHPMPVCACAISPAVPDTEDKPREGRYQECKKMPFPGCPEYPSRTIKQGKDSMKDKEKNVQEGVPHAKLVET